MSKQPKRGEIWQLDWSPARGSEQAGFRPALVIQTDAANSNPNYPNTVVLAVSTKGKPVPFHVASTLPNATALKKPPSSSANRFLPLPKSG